MNEDVFNMQFDPKSFNSITSYGNVYVLCEKIDGTTKVLSVHDEYIKISDTSNKFVVGPIPYFKKSDHKFPHPIMAPNERKKTKDFDLPDLPDLDKFDFSEMNNGFK